MGVTSQINVKSDQFFEYRRVPFSPQKMQSSESYGFLYFTVVTPPFYSGMRRITFSHVHFEFELSP